MYMLLEISEQHIIIFGIILVVILLTAGVILLVFSKKEKVKPIDENDRFEEPEVEFKKIEELTDEQKKAREELERVFNKMNEDLQKESETVVDTFEREQEENAIISYQELIKQVKGVKEEPAEINKPLVEPVIKEDFKPLEIEDVPFKFSDIEKEIEKPREEKGSYLEALENLKSSIDTKQVVEPERKPYSGSLTKFNTSEIISPIYGRQEPVQKEENFDVDETFSTLSKESEKQQNEDFLNSLKEFRNNL